ncbi:hypothetical protein WJX73_007477 [Symbiochloris irregularis]|uniref:Pre-mRNA processing factor 4 (PRP4)-like domain-containing protein n=1 Tax=Symbiochloris irregularis TaxID=706552 RepID=A0AAW1P085_9CHLO
MEPEEANADGGTVDVDMPEAAELPEASRQTRALAEEKIRQVELRRKLKATVVPTNDGDVRALLRRAEQPVTLFGEREMERRDRLRHLLATADDETAVKLTAEDGQQQEAAAEALADKMFYTEGTDALKQARIEVARHSLVSAKTRLRRAKRRRLDPDEDEAGERKEALTLARTIANQSSEIGDERPIMACAFRPDGQQLATAAWSGLFKLWQMPLCQRSLTVRAHQDRITGLSWHPRAGTGQDEASANIVTGGVDTTARLWSLEGKELTVLTGHNDRLARTAWHPGGGLIATASYDTTWRLWDAERGQCLLEQEGHSRGVYAVAFQGDGALVASAGLDAIGRIWDLRTGRSIMTLQGHVKGIMSLAFSPNGHLLASGSEDHTARLWDLRKRRCIYTLPCHTSLVSQVCFEPSDGHFFLTAGYDNVAKLWSSTDFQPIKTLAGHEGKVMGADINPEGDGLIATVSYDRTLKLWAPENY